MGIVLVLGYFILKSWGGFRLFVQPLSVAASFTSSTFIVKKLNFLGLKIQEKG